MDNTRCEICGDRIEFLSPHPGDGWWVHENHPADGHDAESGKFHACIYCHASLEDCDHPKMACCAPCYQANGHTQATKPEWRKTPYPRQYIINELILEN